MDAHLARLAADEEEAALLDSIGRWLYRDVSPHVLRLEHADAWPAELVQQMRMLGLFGATIPVEQGGPGLSATIYAKIVARIAIVWMSLSGIFDSHLIMPACVSRLHGADSASVLAEAGCSAGEIAQLQAWSAV